MESHLLQMRGLKLLKIFWLKKLINVASFTDAWIETPDRTCSSRDYTVASFTDAWIETEKKEEKNIGNDSRIFYRCVD